MEEGRDNSASRRTVVLVKRQWLTARAVARSAIAWGAPPGPAPPALSLDSRIDTPAAGASLDKTYRSLAPGVLSASFMNKAKLRSEVVPTLMSLPCSVAQLVFKDLHELVDSWAAVSPAL